MDSRRMQIRIYELAAQHNVHAEALRYLLGQNGMSRPTPASLVPRDSAARIIMRSRRDHSP